MDDSAADRIRALGEILREFDLDALRVREGAFELELVRREPATAGPYLVAGGPAYAAAGPTAEVPAAPGGAPVAGVGTLRVTAPVVGVFYRASSPDAEAFVEVGQTVVPGQVLCILEAMKLMNEITCEHAGTVTRILPANGELVSLGDDLVWIQPG